MALVVVYRVGLAWLTTHGWVRSGQGGAGDWAPNFCPLAALALGGGTFFSRRLAWAMPLAVTLVSDQVINLFYGQAEAGWDAAFLSRYACLLALGIVGRGYRSAGWDRLSSGPWRVASFLALTALGSTTFYLVTNTFCWWGSRDYPQTISGWLQALTTGLPGYPPTWIFFRNALVSDLLYSMVLTVSMGPMPRRALAPVAPSAWCLPPRNPGPLGPGRPLL